jgi:hypothetical protein
LRRLVDAGMPADRITTIHLGVDSAAFSYARQPSHEFRASGRARFLMVFPTCSSGEGLWPRRTSSTVRP